MSAIVVVAGSSGALDPIRRIVAALPTPCLASVFIVMHIGNQPSVLPFLLNQSGPLPASFAEDGALIEMGHIYIAPPDRHMLLEPDRIRLSHSPKVHYTRPAADPLFISAARVFGQRVIGIVLSGGDSDGAAGLRAIREHGGTTLVQHPEDAKTPSMPLAALLADNPDVVSSVDEIAQRITSFCQET
jgi:two-component system chemotaxis response regulator CheB